jgi:regulator of replication initiation timing
MKDNNIFSQIKDILEQKEHAFEEHDWERFSKKLPKKVYQNTFKRNVFKYAATTLIFGFGVATVAQFIKIDALRNEVLDLFKQNKSLTNETKSMHAKLSRLTQANDSLLLENEKMGVEISQLTGRKNIFEKSTKKNSRKKGKRKITLKKTMPADTVQVAKKGFFKRIGAGIKSLFGKKNKAIKDSSSTIIEIDSLDLEN